MDERDYIGMTDSAAPGMRSKEIGICGRIMSTKIVGGLKRNSELAY